MLCFFKAGPGSVNSVFRCFRAYLDRDFYTEHKNLLQMEFCRSACTSGVPSFITFDKTMKMPGAKVLWVGFRIFFVSLKDFFKKNEIKG